ncbi:DUF3071 domain-containing protein [Leucobacter sp. UCMA 4100]|uniref:septation protein SepH n=1 Tax=Leucobacter sp. UCMA 4100 TaxID=2810534 RepID=UPI0022EAB756|nr:septation protein SepH [Leucobacter sp. UCMA 4100]MDA3148228.1 DUF3071 domain-containing protein [Leucobacter sp. UCMA 4100]
MQDLRLIERRDQTLVLESIDGTEFTLEVTEEVVTAVHVITRAQQAKASETKVSPREVQTMLREGNSVIEVAVALNIEEEDVERYAEPINAEFRFILDLALGVPVRADVADQDEPQFFGAVIEARLAKLGATTHAWRTWRDPEDGWMVLLTFTSHDVEHEARWAFEHRKRLLTPITPDAINLSKQGDVGDKLIPTLRAVDRPEERGSFNAVNFEPEAAEEPAEAAENEAPAETEEPVSPHSDFERRQAIEQRTIATEPEPRDLGQTSDLLDALRKRRSERDAQDLELDLDLPETRTQEVIQVTPAASADESAEEGGSTPADEPQPEVKPNVNIWAPPAGPSEAKTEETTAAPKPEAVKSAAAEPAEASEPEPQGDEKRSKKGRQSIPSWDEILFGTRSEDD